MKVFISWSGDRSKKVAELFDSWLNCVIQAVDPWISTSIDRGSVWFSTINDQLATTSVGIVCLTQENKDKPWILFESGALAKGLNSNKVITFLIDLLPSDLQDPLAQFNHTLPTKTGLLSLVNTINAELGEKALKENILIKSFETFWPQFEREFEEIITNTPKTVAKVEKRDTADILNELLNSVRGIEKRVREIEGASERKQSFMVHDYFGSPENPIQIKWSKTLRDKLGFPDEGSGSGS